jgi:predicted nucleotidyltransferase
VKKRLDINPYGCEVSMNGYLNPKILNEITERLIEVYQPVSIYLFGSYVWGKPGASSDIDLLILLEESSLDSAERIRKGLRQLTDIQMGVDLLVLTRAEFEEKKDHPSTLSHKIFQKGLKLYDAA